MPTLLRLATAPVRRFLNLTSAAVNPQFGENSEHVSTADGSPGGDGERERAMRARWLERVDVAEHNRGGDPPGFADFDSHATSAAQCVDPAYLAWYELLLPGWLQDAIAHTEGGRDWETRGGVFGAPIAVFNRKVWEWACIAELASQKVRSVSQGRALGFGVGNEPLPALFASWGMDILATDQPPENGGNWAETNELLHGFEGLSRPHLLSDSELKRRLTIRAVDMNHIPGDLGTFDLIWSSCALEHLGSPELGLDFVEKSCGLLRPGGLAIHTTELELSRKDATADYGHCAVYRAQDLRACIDRMREQGYETSINTYITMDTPQDRWMDLASADAKLTEMAHLRVVIGDSVTTSFGLLFRRPPT